MLACAKGTLTAVRSNHGGRNPRSTHLLSVDVNAAPHSLHGVGRHQRLALANVALAEQELAVEVARLDGVHVDLHGQMQRGPGKRVRVSHARLAHHVNVAEARYDERLQQLAAYAASAHCQHASIRNLQHATQRRERTRQEKTCGPSLSQPGP